MIHLFVVRACGVCSLLSSSSSSSSSISRLSDLPWENFLIIRNTLAFYFLLPSTVNSSALTLIVVLSL